MTAVTDKKLRDKIMKEKTLELKTNNSIDQTEYIPKEKRNEYNTRGFDIRKGKTHNKRRTDTKNGTIRDKTGK